LRAAGLDRRLAALAAAVELAGGRLEGDALEEARRVLARAGERLGFGAEATVVALAGPTGAGKSTLFNALAGGELVEAGRLRPTTAKATAAVWGDPPHELLDWLGVAIRHPIADPGRDGLVLIDLPDFDSVQPSHRLEADRLIELVDLLVWVVDPQKYADASLHEGYLARFGAHEDAMAVALNQADLLAPEALEACRSDLRGLLRRNGLERVPVLAVSATSGEGMGELEGLLEDRVRRREAASARLSADVGEVAAALAANCGDAARKGVDRAGRKRLFDALSQAAGVPLVVAAVDSAHQRRGALAAGWPLVRWLRRLRPDPLRRLRIGESPREDVRTSLPTPTPVQRSQADSALRTLAADCSGGLPEPWPSAVRAAATAHEDDLGDRLDRAIAGAKLPMRRPRWWLVAGLLQRLLSSVALIGALWLLVLVGLSYLQLDDAIPTPDLEGLPVPTLLVVGGLLGGLLLAWIARIVNGVGARRRARVATRELRGRIEGVAEELVVVPVEDELRAYERICAELATAGSA